jgi:cytochrome P450
MMVREATKDEVFRKRAVRPGAQVVLSPWHLHRHSRLWSNPDVFDPGRWRDADSKQAIRDAYLPFSSGPRVCIGAGFAMMEGVLLLAALLKTHQFTVDPARIPIPAAHLTVRSENGIWLRITRR